MTNPENSPKPVRNNLIPPEWVQYDLGHKFPHLAPDSEVGAMGIDLCVDKSMATTDLAELQEGDPPANIAELNEIKFAEALSRLATLKYTVYEHLYERVNEWVGKMSYLDAVITSCQIVSTAIEEQENLSDTVKQSLLGLVDALGLFYQLESDQHFEHAD